MLFLTNRKKRHFTFTLSFFILIFSQGCKKEEVKKEIPPTEVLTYTVQSKKVPVMKEWVGQTFGESDIQIRARVDGFIEGLFFKEGSAVEKGALLYTINSDELKQKLNDAQGKLTEAQTMLVKAKNDVDRYKPLAEAGAVSQQRYESAVAYYESMQGQVESATAGVRIAEINLGYASVTAPISGVIGISQMYEGDYVSKLQGSLLNTISNIDPIKVRFSISEQEYLNLKRASFEDKKNRGGFSKSVEMLLSDGTLYPYKGEANLANRQVDASTGTMTIESSFPNPEKLLRPGQFSKIRADITVIENALIIPLRSIIDMQGTFNVFVVGNDNKVQLKKIKKGIDYGQFSIVESGLTAGEKVITEGMLKIKPDMIVDPKDITSTFDVNFEKPGSAE